MDIHLNHIPSPVVLLDKDFMIIKCNDLAKKLFQGGVSPSFLKDLVIQNRDELGQDSYRLYTDRRDCVLNLKLSTLGNRELLCFIEEEHPYESISSELMKSVGNNHRIGYWKVDVKRQRCFWSKVTYEIHEEDPGKEIKLSQGIKYYIEEHRPIISKAVQEGISKNKAWNEELKIKTAKGKVRWVRAIGYPVLDREGNLIRLEGSFEDIHKQKLSTIEMSHIKDRFDIVKDAVNFGIWDWDYKNNNLVWDDNMYTLYGVKRDEFEGDYQAFEKTLHPEDVKKVLDDLEHTFLNQKDFFSEFRILSENNGVRHISAKARCFYDDNGNIERLVGVNYDISETKLKQEQLDLIVSTTSDGVWDWRVDRDFEYMSPKFWEILGYRPEEKRHHPDEWKKLIHSNDLEVALDNFNKHVETKGEHPFWQECRYKHKNGSTVWVICQGKVVEWDNEGNPLRMVGTHTDITPLKLSQEKREHNSKMITLGEMAGGIAHEVNNPLAIIDGNIRHLSMMTEKGLIEDKKDIFTKKCKEVKEMVGRIGKVINSLRNFAKKDDGEMNDYYLLDIVEDSLSLCFERCRNRGIKLINNVGDEKVLCDNGQIEQVVINLLNNSIQALEKIKNAQIILDSKVFDGKVILEVCDNGPGVDPKIASKIMDPFVTTKGAGVGTGLGLSISKKIMERHNGKLKHSFENGLTKFSLIFHGGLSS